MAERQLAETVDGIRADHVERYKWAAERVSGNVADLACGCGYGTAILADAGCLALGIDGDESAIRWAEKHYRRVGYTIYAVGDIRTHYLAPGFDAVVCFETLEHVEEDAALLRRFAGATDTLLLSVPNEASIPFDPRRFPYHVRHYTPDQIERVLMDNGWTVAEWWTQADAHSPVVPGHTGRTLVMRCALQ